MQKKKKKVRKRSKKSLNRKILESIRTHFRIKVTSLKWSLSEIQIIP